MASFKLEPTKQAKHVSPKILILSGLILIFAVVAIINESKQSNYVPITNTAPPSSATPPKTGPQVPKGASPNVYTGTGDDVVSVSKPSGSGPAILAFDCPSCTENTEVQTNGADSLIINTIGAYSGAHLIDSVDGSATSKVTITATGAWTLTLSGLDKATTASGKNVSGTGDAVVFMPDEFDTAAITNIETGSDNFIVQVFSKSGTGPGVLSVNTLGSYKGAVPFQTPAYVQVISSGKWTISSY